jgi:hypothetical protein
MDQLRSALSPVATGDGTRLATWHLPDGSTRTARVRCSLDVGERKVSTLRVVVTLTLPAGRFT